MTKPSSTKPQHNSHYVFFTDADLGEIVPRALEEPGYTVERHAKHFPGPTKDAVWLAEVGRRGWVALTHDKAQRKTPDEVAAIMTSGVANFILMGKNHTEICQNLVKSIRSVIAFRDKHDPPFIAKLYLPESRAREHARVSGGTAKGRVEMSLAYSDWLNQRA